MPVTAVDLNLWDLGEDPQQPPAQWAFTFVAGGFAGMSVWAKR